MYLIKSHIDQGHLRLSFAMQLSIAVDFGLRRGITFKSTYKLLFYVLLARYINFKKMTRTSS